MSTLTLYYDFAHGPPTWNFFDALLLLEMERLDKGHQKARVRLVAGPKEGFRWDGLPPYGGPERRRWAENICVPMPVMLPSCGEPAEWIERCDAEKDRGPSIGLGGQTHGFKHNGAAAKRGLFPFRVPEKMVHAAFALAGQRYVTITLRETGWHQSRQSKLDRWLPIAQAIQNCGFKVIFIRDAARATEPIEGFETAPAASTNSLARGAFYAGAEMNLGIANGPLWFAWFMKAPVLICNLVHNDEPCASVHSYSWGGLKPGDTGFPNSHARQRLLWGVDEPSAVLAVFAELMEPANA